MKALRTVAAILGLVIVLPIWYYLMYKILSLVQATELMWFLFWIYIPVHLFAALVAKVAESVSDA